jgi:hypothetical protein
MLQQSAHTKERLQKHEPCDAPLSQPQPQRHMQKRHTQQQGQQLQAQADGAAAPLVLGIYQGVMGIPSTQPVAELWDESREGQQRQQQQQQQPAVWGSGGGGGFPLCLGAQPSGLEDPEGDPGEDPFPPDSRGPQGASSAPSYACLCWGRGSHQAYVRLCCGSASGW